MKNQNEISVFVEINKNSNVKYEYDKNIKQLVLDRILFGSNVYPENYGFIPETLDYDGDPLDVILISNNSILPGIIVRAKIIGVMYMNDQNEIDNKIIATIIGDNEFSHVNDITDICNYRLEKIKDFFRNYKILEKKDVEVKEIKNAKYGEEILNHCAGLYKKYKNEYISIKDKKKLVNIIK